ncbi:MAG: CinA family protein [Bdellovibrionales bacterium]
MLKEQIFEYFKKNNKTLSLVESCTGGGLCRDFVLIPGASEVFRGSLVAYQDFSKNECLKIDQKLINEHTSVSNVVAAEMSKKGASFFHSDVCLATTGWAGPSGGTAADPVGTVYFAVCGEGLELVERRTFTECNDRSSLMESANEYAWKMLARALKISE